MVTSGIGRPGVQGQNCVTQTVFFPGDEIVFRAVVADGPTGRPLGPADIQRLGLRVTVTLSDGTTLPLHFISQPPNAPVHMTYWAVRTRIAPDHPTGTLAWKLAVTHGAGHTTAFTPLGAAAGTPVVARVPAS